jgi:3',5'-cyclic AMP phosphodiesterase CpdA
VPDRGLTPPPGARLVRLIHLSDLHFGAEDAHALAGVTAFLEASRPDALIVSGDLTQAGTRAEFEAARAWLESLEAPVLVAPGNHDTPVLHVGARVFRPFGRYARILSRFDVVDRLTELADGAVRVSAINTARGVQARRNWADGVVDLDELDDALAHLAGGPPDAWRLLVCHHPLVEPSHSRIRVSTLRGSEALRRAAKAGVDAVLTGHIHDAFAHQLEPGRRRLVQLGSGTLSTRLRGTPPSFCVIELTADRLVQLLVRLHGGDAEVTQTFVSEPLGNI